MSRARILRPSQRPPAMRIAGFDIRTLISGDEAQGFEVFHTQGQAGTGPAPHSHPWDETFFVIRGPVVFGVGDHEDVIEAGSLVHVPGGERHWYRFGPEEGEFVSLTSGKAAASMYRELAQLPAGSAPTHYRAVASQHGQSARLDP